MTLRSLGQLFKINKKNEKIDNEQLLLPGEGFDKCIKLLLAYCGKDEAEFTVRESCECNQKYEGSGETKISLHGTAVLRYLGRCNGLAGADPFEDLEIDKIVDVFNDFVIKVLTLEKVENPELKAKQVSKFNESEALVYLNKFDAVIATNKGHLALSKFTWADFLVTGMWDHIKDVLQIHCEGKFPNINSMVNSVTSISSAKLALKKTEDSPNVPLS